MIDIFVRRIDAQKHFRIPRFMPFTHTLPNILNHYLGELSLYTIAMSKDEFFNLSSRMVEWIQHEQQNNVFKKPRSFK